MFANNTKKCDRKFIRNCSLLNKGRLVERQLLKLALNFAIKFITKISYLYKFPSGTISTIIQMQFLFMKGIATLSFTIELPFKCTL